MSATMTEKTQTLAVDEQPSFTPTKVFFINSSSGDFSDELHVLDLTSNVTLSPCSSTSPIPDSLRDEVERAASEQKNDRSAWSFELTRGTFSSTMEFHDASAGGAVAAELDMPVLKHYSVWKVRFPEGSPHSSHDVEVRPVSIWKKQETFVKDSVPYLWDMSMGGKGGVLYKTVEFEKRVPVAQFVAKNWFKNCCVLVLDDRQLDAVVALSTCVAVLNRDI
ncbi:hypothetical protein PCL_04479 [Purpureocillium lilacinum]|uniref:Uncharacterized protein n=1 Tax=Purpureocillium lilacinum TaxID=33203 RepID=A0A2U3DXJ8_PURLI|nr:hypothetical protein PCL_04479 [Purpureocillium lilacinum]GJN75638.1 hypothetical protein PLICBS_009743 [Purpureocillium lilacinum]